MLQYLDFMGFTCIPNSDEYLLSSLAGAVPDYEEFGDIEYPCCYTEERKIIDPSEIDEMKLLVKSKSIGSGLHNVGAHLVRKTRAQSEVVERHKKSELHQEYRQGKALTLSDWEYIYGAMSGKGPVNLSPSNYLYHVYSYILPDMSASPSVLKRFEDKTMACDYPVVLYADRQYPGMVFAMHMLLGVAMRMVVVTGAEIPNWMYSNGRIATVAVGNVGRGVVRLKAMPYYGQQFYHRDQVDKLYHTGTVYSYPSDVDTILRALRFDDDDVDCIGLSPGFDYIKLMHFAMRCKVLVRQRLAEYVFPSALPAQVRWLSSGRHFGALPAWVVFGPCGVGGAPKLVGYHWAGRDLRIGAVMGVVERANI